MGCGFIGKLGELLDLDFLWGIKRRRSLLIFSVAK